MEITEVRIKLVENGNERLRAFCSITLDGDFVIRDLKVIDGSNGPFVAMPSRKLMDRCARCGAKNHLRARFCNECGAKLNDNRAPKDQQGRAKLHADVAHPINAACRERVQRSVVEAYEAELERAKSPDYKPISLDEYDDFDDDLSHGDQGGHSVHNEPVQAKPSPEPQEKPVDDKEDDAFGDYNALIQDLKREAQQRRGNDRPERSTSSYTPINPVGQSEPRHAAHEVEDRPEPKPAAPAPRPAPAPQPAPSPPAAQQSDDFGQGL